MNKTNYDKELNFIIEENVKKNVKPTLLLHSCCAPCSSTCIERLIRGFSVTVLYYNPNIDPLNEYEKRRDEQIRFCEEFGVQCITLDYQKDEFFDKIKGYECEAEGGKRCFVCFDLRLRKTAYYAKEKGFDFFATTLTLSPLKNAEKINEIGNKISSELNVKYLPTDFKKNGGYLRSIELSKEYNLYRQNYCGCIFSKR